MKNITDFIKNKDFLPDSEVRAHEAIVKSKKEDSIVLVTYPEFTSDGDPESFKSIFTIEILEEVTQDEASIQIENLDKKIEKIEEFYEEKTEEEQKKLWDELVKIEKEKNILIEKKKKHALLEPIEKSFGVSSDREEFEHENKKYSRFSVQLNFQQMCNLLDVSEEEAKEMPHFKQYFENQALKKKKEEINSLLFKALQNNKQEEKLIFSYDATSIYLTLTESLNKNSEFTENLKLLRDYFREIDDNNLEIESTIRTKSGNGLFDSNEKLVTYSLKVDLYKLPLDIGLEVGEKQKISALQNLKKGHFHDKGVQMVALRSLYLDNNGSLDVIDSRCNPEKVLREQLQEITYDDLTFEKNGRKSTYNGRELDSVFYKGVELYETTTDNYHDFFKFLNISKNYKNGSSLEYHEFNENYFKEMEEKGICLLYDKEHYYNNIPTIKKDTTKLLNENLNQSNESFIPEVFFEMPVAVLLYQLALFKKTTLVDNKEELKKIENILPELKEKANAAIEKLNGYTLSKKQWENVTEKAGKSYQLINEKNQSTKVNFSN